MISRHFLCKMEQRLTTAELTVTVQNHIVTAILNRPALRNALNDALYTALIKVLRAVDEDDRIFALVLTGAGSHFCSGQDLSDVDLAERASKPSSSLPVGKFMTAITSFRKLLVAAVNGPAVGIGATLLAHCDVIVANENATLWTPFVKLGVVPEFGSSLLFPERGNRALAVRLLLLGEKMTARECYNFGLYTHLIPGQEDVVTACQTILKRAAQRDHALGASWQEYKAILGRAAQTDSLQSVIDMELALIDERFRSGQVASMLTTGSLTDRVKQSKL
eukprot:TRINITY_DN6058_c0_g1_i1.p1 TRINITY_DN6058_c0_g1~~TRINITY_DN6058_c0_g1_i1.p1  ORF type:complete len:278 (+),score=38.70 TRINITY_DN6058_c0_g1_i1:153-986(+)